jgi:hypothetical protein
MELHEPITASAFRRDVSALAGMKVSSVWLGGANVLFLECGRLWKRPVPAHWLRMRMPPGCHRRRFTLKGQVSLMLHSVWRVESGQEVEFGWSDKDLSERLGPLAGQRIRSVKAVGDVPELEITMGNRQVIRTFQSFEGRPLWSIGYHDMALANCEPEWKLKQNDVSMWLKFDGGSFVRAYCFDQTTFEPKAFLAQYGYRFDR